MKVYIVYIAGREVGYIKAGSHNAAERKAQAMFGQSVLVVYTEMSDKEYARFALVRGR